jgi:hypothetical protein
MAITQDLISKYYLPEIKFSNVVIEARTIGTTPERIIENDPSRFQFVVINLSSNDVFVGFDNKVSSFNGIRLAPNGGTLRFIWMQDLQIVTWEFFAMASGANSNILIIKFVLV